MGENFSGANINIYTKHVNAFLCCALNIFSVLEFHFYIVDEILIIKSFIMKHSLLLTILLINFVANAQQFDWAQGYGSFVQDEGKSITTDANGNVFTTGTFRFDADFDAGADTFSLTSQGGSDVFVQKLDATGNFVWAVSMGGTSFEIVHSIFVDNAGFVYLTGSFTGEADFNPAPADTFNLTSAGIDDIFVVKLSPSGSFIWAKSMGGPSTDEGFSVAVDAGSNVYVGGRFQGTSNFNTTGGTTTLTANGSSDDFFICKLNSNGELIWAHGTGGFNNDYCINIALDNSANIIATGYYNSGSIDFDPGVNNSTLSHNGASDIFISKYDASGNFLWAKGFGSSGYDVGYDIVADASGNIYATGRFENTVDFDPGNNAVDITSAGAQDIYLLKLDANGNYVWAKGMGSSLAEWGQAVDLDGVGGLYLTGYFQLTVDFDPSGNTTNLTSSGGEDIFVSKYNTDGNFVWALAMGGTNAQFGDRGEDISVDGAGSVYTTGWFYDVADFDPTVGIENVTSQGSFDVFVHKIAQPGNGVTNLVADDLIKTFPNPTNGNITLNYLGESLISELIITSFTGQIVSKIEPEPASTVNISLPSQVGVYFIHLKDKAGNAKTSRVAKY